MTCTLAPLQHPLLYQIVYCYMTLADFKKKIWEFYHENGRDLAWRHTKNPYHIYVSEVMLQQTQVSRVTTKYPEFLAAFPDIPSLAYSCINDVYKVWQGMGYNRRALYLKRAAEMIVKDHKGKVPDDPDELQSLPGIGHATARSITAFAYNTPTVFIETNIRRVYLHFFFPDKEKVNDNEVLPLVEKTVDTKNPREWYYALMDFGTMLAKIAGNANTRSAHYTKQSKFEGSNRQVRAATLRALSAKPQSLAQLCKTLTYDKSIIDKNLNALKNEGFIVKKNSTYHVQ